MPEAARVSTGFPSLDQILAGLRLGDNVVWSVDSVDDYRSFVLPFVQQARQDGRRVVYLRFGVHPPLLEPAAGVERIELDPRLGFESFATRIHGIITEYGREIFYVFDCLSDLLSAWATDLMIGNFFWITCPYLFELDTVAYFALIRDRHSLKTIERIRETTQILLDVYNFEESIHIHPLKVWQRHSPTMFLPHIRRGERFVPLANSYEATRLLSTRAGSSPGLARRQLDHWHRLFLQAGDLAGGEGTNEQRQEMVDHLCRHLIGRDERMLELARRYFSLADLLAIKSRMIGTGFIGGKAVGMLLARDILLQDRQFDWDRVLEPHDSFFVGSNVYYSYLVHNGWWKLYMQQKTREGYFTAASELRERMRSGVFPETVRQGFQEMLEYYGQYPIIVRSSSLLEDGFGNAFAGKYDSFFLPNQGTPEERLARLEAAVRQIFASAMSEDALTYRLQRGLDQKDEQMALLVQRVSGAYRHQYYFPDLAGVAVSYNTFVWDKEMDPKAGMLRLVLGLGTRAVDRVEGDYPRLAALDAPLKQPHKGFEDTRRFSQRDVDLLDINANELRTLPFRLLVQEGVDLPLASCAVRDMEGERRFQEQGRRVEALWLLTFDRLLGEGAFTPLMQRLLKTLEAAYQYPVDVEFTVNYVDEGSPRINVVQCRPLQTKGEEIRADLPRDLPEERIFFRSEGNFMGGNITLPIDWVIWVEPAEYTRLPLADKYELARLIGRLTRRLGEGRELSVLLMGPGRWGTSTPSLGVPVSFSEISGIAALAEVAFTSGDLMPELSFGSHFFQDLVETDIFYLALFPENREVLFAKGWLDRFPNALEEVMPADGRFAKVIKVVRTVDADLQLIADVVAQKLVCFHA